MLHARNKLHVGVLALQGAFSEHIQLLKQAFQFLEADGQAFSWTCGEIRTKEQLTACDALIIPGGESTTIALVAEESGLLEPLRDFVKVERRPTWGTCAGLILLAESANRTKKGGQELIGGIDVRVNRNHFGRQVESFERDLDLSFLRETTGLGSDGSLKPFKGIFIRAPVVEKLLPQKAGIQDDEVQRPDTVVAPSKPQDSSNPSGSEDFQVEVLAILPGRASMPSIASSVETSDAGDIVAVKQRNVFGTSFHPELTNDARIHIWWLQQARELCLGR